MAAAGEPSAIPPVSGEPADLVTAYGLPRRVALRVAALAAKGLGVSETLAESLADEEPLRRVLLDPSIYEHGGALQARDLKAAEARHAPEGGATPLALLAPIDGEHETPAGPIQRLLVLEEEAIAARRTPLSPAEADTGATSDEPASSAAVTPPEGAPGTGRSLAVRRPGGVGEHVTLFDDQEISRLQVTLLTSTDANAKIEAIRKLRLIELDPSDRASLLLEAIGDEDERVRREAVEGLTDLGLSARVAELVGQLTAEDETEREGALTALSRHAEGAQPAELRVVFAVLVGTLRARGTTVSLQRGLLRTLAVVAPPIIRDDPSALEQLHRPVARLVGTRYAELSRDALLLWRAIGPAAPQEVRAQLLREAFDNAADDPRSRTFYLALRAELDPDPGALSSLIQEMADRAIRGGELDPTSGQLASALRSFGADGIRAILASLRRDDLDDAQQNATASLLTSIFYGSLMQASTAADGTAGDRPSVDAGVADEVAATLAHVYAEARTQTRQTVLDCPFITHPGVTPATRRELAAALLDDLHEQGYEQTRNQIGSVLRKLGPMILPVLRDQAARGRYSIGREFAVQIAGRIAVDYVRVTRPDELGEIDGRLAERLTRVRAGLVVHAGEMPALGDRAAPAIDPGRDTEAVREELRQTYAAFRDLSKQDDCNERGLLFITTAQLGATGLMDRETVGDLARFFLDSVRGTSHAYAIVEALGWIGIAPSLSLGLRSDVAEFLVDLLKADYPEKLSRRRRGEEGIVYELGHETTAYTDLLPSVMHGLQRLALTPVVEPPTRQHILATLLDVWASLVEFRVVWGPQNITDLAEVLGQIGLSSLYDPSERSPIVEALLLKTSSLTVKAILGELIVRGEQSGRMAVLAQQLFRELEDEYTTESGLEQNERKTILVSMVRIASRPRIGAGEEDATRTRERAAGYILDAIRDGMVDLAVPLRSLAGEPFLNGDLAAEIERRLRRFRLWPEG